MEQNVAAAAHDFSLIGMYMGADPIVKGVMIALGLASVICWAIILEKMIRMFILRRDLRAMESFAKSPSSVSQTRGLTRVLLSAAESEAIEGTSRGEDRSDVRARLEKAMRTALKSQLQRIEVGLPFLATVGSAAPFIGLFGTVWGIMNSFTAIAAMRNTNLAVVAPGIAEALFATAIGLVAAIPAVIAYNKISAELANYAARLEGFATEFAALLSRQAEQPAHQRQAAE